MTALTIPARPQDVSLRPVPWRQMAWVVWRQHRIALVGVTALLGALAIYLWVTGLQMHHAYSAAIGCRPASSLLCGNALDNFNNTYWSPAEVIAALLQVVPAVIGAFVGAPLLARELETGTFRFAWTQGFGRQRWAVAKLVPLAVVLTAATGALSILFSWYYQPFFAEQQQSPFVPDLFNLRGVAFAAWTLAAFAIGALAGMLIRRVVPAIAATLAVYTGLTLAVDLYLRQRYMAPLATSNPNLPGSAWVISQWWTKGSQPVSQATINQILQGYQPAVTQIGPNTFQKGSGINPVQYLTQHGYTLWTSYQPASRFWPFQWIEGGWLLALSVLLIAATVWLVGRRAA
jgi:ABC-type transport system involved in multi-copper enzyme maturation permease subunit